jgi:HK97 family phage portal protein
MSERMRARRLNRIAAQREVRDGRSIPTQRIAYTGRTSAGVVITGDTAMTIAAVFACIRYLTQSIAALPWQLRKPKGMNGRSSEPVQRHPVKYMIESRSAPDWSSFQFRETLMNWALRRGNGYAEIERNIIDQPVRMHPIHPDRVEVYRDNETQDLVYLIDGKTRLEARDVFHIRGFGDGPVGLNVVAYAAESLGWAKAAQLFGSSFFGSGATPSGIVTMKRTLTPEGLLALEDRFKKLYGGPKNQNKTAFLDNEMDYKSIGIEPEKGQFIETNQHLIDEVCRWFGVPPHKIYHLLRATFSNIEHQSIEVVTDSLRPWAKRFEDEADYKLFGEENRQGFFTRMDFTDMLRGDTASRLAYYRGMREIAVLNADEIREFEDLQPIGKAGGGEKRVMQGQYTTLEKIGETPEPAPQPAATPAPAEEDPDEDEDEEPAATPAPPAPKTQDVVRFMTAINSMRVPCAAAVN